jgi:porin
MTQGAFLSNRRSIALDRFRRGGLIICGASLATFWAASGALADPASASADSGSQASSTSAASPASTSADQGDFVEQPVDAGAAASAASGPSITPFGFLDNISRSSTMLGDMWGLRPLLGKYGMTLSVQEQSEVFGNLSGGVHQGFEYDGLTTATLQLDTQRAFGWYGGLFNVSALQIHGRNVSADNLDALQTVSGIEADRATRLWELWYQQQFDDGKFDVKIGQQSIDQEFLVSQNSGYFINTMMGWPMLPSADLPGGGPAYPLSALGVRLRSHISDSLTLLTGVYNGSPSPTNVGDPQLADPSGTSFPLNGGVLAIAELQYSDPASNSVVAPGSSDPLPRTYKIGAWYDSEDFADLRVDDQGLSLANPASDGIPAEHRGDYAFYAVADQMIYRSSDDPSRNLNFFVRPMFTPLQDRNLINFSVNAGLTLHEPFEGRDSDTAGLGMGFTQVSQGAIGLDEDTANFNPGVFSPVRSNETFIEATYQYQVTPWWQIQPDFQYIFNPGGGIVDPDNPLRKIADEAVLGVRTTIQF